jgi:hypothetical protein
VKTPRHIPLLALLTLGNVFPSEAVGQIVEFDISRNPGHLKSASAKSLLSRLYCRSHNCDAAVVLPNF